MALSKSKFIQPLDSKYKCCYCSDSLRIPVKQTSCGHRLCSACVDELCGSSGSSMCPANERGCVLLSTQNIYPDKGTDRELGEMSVFCRNTPNCTIILKLKSLDDHLKTCKFQLIACPNATRGCPVIVLTHDVVRHLSEGCEFETFICQHCENSIVCKERQKHEKACLSEVIFCVFKEEGCEFQSSRAKVLVHLQSRDGIGRHLIMAIKSLRAITIENEQLKDRVQQLEGNSKVIDKQVANINCELQDAAHKAIESQERIKQSIQSRASKNRNLEDAHHKIISNYQQITKLQKRVTQLETKQLFAKDSKPSDQRFYDTDERKQLDRTARMLAQHDVVLAEYEVRLRCHETANYAGMLIWKISNLAHRKEVSMTGQMKSLYSQPFYSHRYGYKMCARIYLAGDGLGKGSHVSLYFVVMKGENDDLLTWPFQQRVTMVLLDQQLHKNHITDVFRPDPTSASFVKPVNQMNVASGSPLFVAQSRINQPPYCVDDTIFIMVKVDMSDLKHF